jgi:hypothetical protein
MAGRRTLQATLVAAVTIALGSGSALAHAGALGGSLQSSAVPSWLLVLTGGSVVGASFLFATLMTDHDAIRAINAVGARLRRPSWSRWLSTGLNAASVLVLFVILVSGLIGPRTPTANFAVVVVWAGWWAGYTMSVYLLADTWRYINPWRSVTDLLAATDRPVPARWGAWPAIVGLLGLVWVEVVSPVSEDPSLLVAVIAVYSVVTVAGGLRYVDWFDRVDPISRIFRCYGLLAPVQRTENGIEFRLPSAALTDGSVSVDSRFVVAVLWVTTYDGMVSTPAWRTLAGWFVEAGIPAIVVYLAAILVGFGIFLGAYRLAAGYARRTADTYVTSRFIGEWLAPSLLPIAAGYHLAHFLGYLISLLPTLGAVITHPLTRPPVLQVLTIPGWFSGLQLAFVVIGHLFAVWVAHARSFELFPGRLQPVRSQYPFIVIMILYTITSLWIVSRPFGSPPFV